MSEFQDTMAMDRDKSVSREEPFCGDYLYQPSDIEGNAAVKLISREELKEKLDNGEDIKLIFVLGEWQYHTMHIPGSLNLYKPQDALKVLKQDDEIVVYCSNEACPASIFAYKFLVAHGFKNVRRYAGGLMDWSEAGYPLEGEGMN